MSEQLDHCVARVFIKVLEDVAMMFGDEVQKHDLVPSPGGHIAIEIEFTGSGQGLVRLMAPECVAAEIAANVLGLDSGHPEAIEAMQDALGELLNVVVGQLLTEACGTEAVFDLSAPSVRGNVGALEWLGFSDLPGTVAVEAEDSVILLGVEVSDQFRVGDGVTR